MDKVERKIALLFVALFAVSAIAIFSCKPREIVVSEKTVRDSTVNKKWVEYRDTSFIIEADSAAIMALVPGCPDSPEQTSANGRVKLKVSIKDGKLKADCSCLETEAKLKLATYHIETLNKRFERQHDTRIVQVKFIPQWVKYFAWSGAVLHALIIIGLIYLAIRIYLKSQIPI